MRVELLHPMIVGFPISFLMFGGFLRISCLFFKQKELYPQLVTFSRILVVIGILFGIIAVFTGEIAHAIVEDHLCNRNILVYHESLGFGMLTIYLLAYLLDRASKWNIIFERIAVVLYCLGPILLILTGYLGGSLVFDQGAAVEQMCKTLAK